MRRPKLWAAAAAAILLPLAIWWWAPGLIDRARYGEVDPRCDEVFALSGDVSGKRVSGRHCHVGTTTISTESGFFVAFEYARDGWVFLWGRGARPTRAAEKTDLSLAMVRTPGDDGRWLCAQGGRWTVPSKGDNELVLSGVGELLDESQLRGEGTLVATRSRIEGRVRSWSVNDRITGWGCGGINTRCDLSANESQAVRVFVRANEDGTLGHAFVLREDQRAARKVWLSVASAASSSFDANGPEPKVSLAGLSSFVECPVAKAQDGTLELRF